MEHKAPNYTLSIAWRKKYPVKREPYGVCNERGVNPYSVEGVEVSAPRIPAIVIVTSPMNIEPND